MTTKIIVLAIYVAILFLIGILASRRVKSMSDYYEGILWYLKQTQANLKYITISTVSQADLSKLDKEHQGKADFIICVDDDMTSTY